MILSTLRRCTGVRLFSTSRPRFTCVLGAQWGDEGKGKLVDILAEDADVVSRFNGGANAGHTIVVKGKKYAFHLLPCGLLYPNAMNVIGNGCVVNVPSMFGELAQLDKDNIDWKGRLYISNRAHMLFEFHKKVDGIQEEFRGSSNIGTTRKGIGPCYSSKTTRNGIRFGDFLNWELFQKQYHELLDAHKIAFKHYGFEHDGEEELAHLKSFRDDVVPMIKDTVTYVNHAYNQGKSILAEGANACLLDVDYGTYPMVTSSSTTTGGISTGMGIAPSKIDNVIGVVKAYTTRVGSGPFPTELTNDIGERLQSVGAEFGVTTGRKRRCGWLDLALMKYSHQINGYNSINITKLDVLSGLEELKIGVNYKIDGKVLPEGSMPSTLEDLTKVEVDYITVPGWKEDISKVTTYNDLPKNARSYLEKIEEILSVPISWVGVGPGRESTIQIAKTI